MRLWLARFCVGLVLGFNLQCAAVFLATPGAYAAAYELSGEVGAAVIRGFGVLFLMWSVPYAVALWHPFRHKVSLWQALVMQVIGTLGELLIWASLSAEHAVLRSAIIRFAGFDGFGVLLLIMAVWISFRQKPKAG